MMNHDENKENNTQPIDESAQNASANTEVNETAEELVGTAPEQDNNTAGEPVEKQKKTSFYKRRSFRYGSMATAFTAIFIVIVILLNVGLTLVAQKYPISADLTKEKDYNITSDTIQYLSKIKTPIVFKCFATKSEMENATTLLSATRIIQQYPKYNSNISIQYFDFDKSPAALAVYSDENIQRGDIIVSTTGADGKERYKHISYGDLLVSQTDSQTGSNSIVGNKAEQQIDNALDYVTATVHPTVLFVQGHNEDTQYNGLQDLLKNENYTVSTVDTVSKDIDANATALAIVAPKNDFSTSEIEKIDKFLKNDGKFGKNIFIFLDPSVKKLTNLEEYMAEWGVKPEDGFIYDSTNSLDNNPFEAIASSVNAEVVGNKVPTSVSTDVAISRPLKVLFDSKDSRTVKTVIQTGDTSRVTLDPKGTAKTDKAGPFTVMTSTTWCSSSNMALESHMLVSGSFQIINTQLLAATNKNNAKVIIGAANTLMSKESSITIPSKYNETTTLSLTTGQRKTISIVFIFAIPLIIILVGFILWFRRRHL